MSESHEPAGEPARTPIIDHVPAENPAPHTGLPAAEPIFAAEDRPTARTAGDLPPPPSAPGAAAPAARRGGTPLPLTLLVCAALAGGIYWTWSHPQEAPHEDPQAAIEAAKSDLLEKLQGLGARVDALEKQAADKQTVAAADADLGKRLGDLAAKQDQQEAALQKLEETAGQRPSQDQTAVPAAPGDAQQLAELGTKLDQALAQEKASLDTLDQRLAKLEQGNPVAAEAQDNKQSIESLGARVQKLEGTESQMAGVKQDATLAVKLAAAQVALSAGQPLGALPGAPPALARFATTPPPTEAALRADFPQAAEAALVASRPEEAQHSFFARALARVEESVTVRQGDHVIVGDPAAGIVAKARQELTDGDLKGAVQTLSALNGPAAQAMKHWMTQAESLLAARAALAQLAAHG